MKTWPKIKLVDGRGRTVTVFKRVPTFEDSEELQVNEVLDFKPGRKPPVGLAPDDPARAAVIADLAQFIQDFITTHGRLPGTVAEHVENDAVAVANALDEITAARGLSIVGREEIAQLARKTASECRWVMPLREVLDQLPANHEGQIEIPPSMIRTHFVGAPQGESEWVVSPKPASKKAAAHIEAELAREGFRIPGPNEYRTLEFDGKELPAWCDVQKVLDSVAEHGEAGDTLTLTTEQLRALIAQRC